MEDNGSEVGEAFSNRLIYLASFNSLAENWIPDSPSRFPEIMKTKMDKITFTSWTRGSSCVSADSDFLSEKTSGLTLLVGLVVKAACDWRDDRAPTMRACGWSLRPWVVYGRFGRSCFCFYVRTHRRRAKTGSELGREVGCGSWGGRLSSPPCGWGGVWSPRRGALSCGPFSIGCPPLSTCPNKAIKQFFRKNWSDLLGTWSQSSHFYDRRLDCRVLFLSPWISLPPPPPFHGVERTF